MYLLRFVTLVPHIPERTRISDRLSRVDHQLSQCLRESLVKLSVSPHSFIHTRGFVLMKGPGFWKQWACWFPVFLWYECIIPDFLYKCTMTTRFHITQFVLSFKSVSYHMFANFIIFTTLFLGRGSTNNTMHHLLM